MSDADEWKIRIKTKPCNMHRKICEWIYLDAYVCKHSHITHWITFNLMEHDKVMGQQMNLAHSTALSSIQMYEYQKQIHLKIYCIWIFHLRFQILFFFIISDWIMQCSKPNQKCILNFSMALLSTVKYIHIHIHSLGYDNDDFNRLCYSLVT